MSESKWLINYKKQCRQIINEFKRVVEDNHYLNTAMKKMIKEIPHKIGKHCKTHVNGYLVTENNSKPENFEEVCNRLYHVITNGPTFYDANNLFNGLPMIDLFAKLVASDTGMLFFGNIIINRYFKKILYLWSQFLMRPESRSVLTSEGWLGMPTMDDFVHDKSRPYYGFRSWNDFFIRKFNDLDRLRPLSDALVVSACDAFYVDLKKNVKYTTDFMRVKGDIYSLRDMLPNVKYGIIKRFIGGGVYQAYLSAETYHRYHSPVDGTVVYMKIVDGSYFLLNNFYDTTKNRKNRFCGQNQVKDSQQFLANVQTRGVCIIKTKNIGYVCLVVIGMTEVSTCIFYQNLLNKQVIRGQELGHFQYGGSTHLLIFEKKYIDRLDFTLNKGNLTKLRSTLANLKDESIQTGGGPKPKIKLKLNQNTELVVKTSKIRQLIH